jgi:hypothetical protein
MEIKTMKSYKYMYLTYGLSSGETIVINSSHKDARDWIVEEIRKLIPTFIDNGHAIYELQHRGLEIYDFVFRLLLDTGWEPFQIEERSITRAYHLRLEIIHDGPTP